MHPLYISNPNQQKKKVTSLYELDMAYIFNDKFYLKWAHEYYF